MNLYPAIDLYQGRVVRLARGDFQAETVYSHDPAGQAGAWEKAGAAWIHVVDLEGAKTGELKNFDSVAAIRKKVSCKIQYGGGVRRLDQAERLIEQGVDRVVVGTRALEERFFGDLLERFGERLAVGLDTREGRVQTDGWLKDSGETLEAVLKKFNKTGLGTVIYTDIAKDGMLDGPNLPGLRQVLDWSRARVILSGGIARLEDLSACRQINDSRFEGVIIGKALYEKRFQLQDALALTRQGT